MIQMNLQNRNRLTDLEKELMVAGGKDGGRDSWGVWDGHGQTDISWITSKALLSSAWNSAQLHGSLDGGEVWGRMDTCICMAESLCCSLELS